MVKEVANFFKILSRSRLAGYEEMEAPVYYVSTPSYMPDLVFPGDEYKGAFHNATGMTFQQSKDDNPEREQDHKGEEDIHIIDFEGTVEIPILGAY